MSLKLWPGLACSSAAVGEMLELIFSLCCGSEGGTVQIHTVIVQKSGSDYCRAARVCDLGKTPISMRGSALDSTGWSPVSQGRLQPACLSSLDKSSGNLCSCLIVRTLYCASRKCLVLRAFISAWQPPYPAPTSIWRSFRAAAPSASPPVDSQSLHQWQDILCRKKPLTSCLISAVLGSRRTAFV